MTWFTLMITIKPCRQMLEGIWFLYAHSGKVIVYFCQFTISCTLNHKTLCFYSRLTSVRLLQVGVILNENKIAQMMYINIENPGNYYVNYFIKPKRDHPPAVTLALRRNNTAKVPNQLVQERDSIYGREQTGHGTPCPWKMKLLFIHASDETIRWIDADEGFLQPTFEPSRCYSRTVSGRQIIFVVAKPRVRIFGRIWFSARNTYYTSNV